MSTEQTTKVCCTCKLLKPVAAFDLELSSKSGRQRRCRQCRHDYGRTQGGDLRNRWRAMRNRCGNAKQKCFKSYGGRGIRVCQEWIDDFPAFFAWAMKNGYRRGLEIDRIDVDGNYEPGNCRWVDKFEQARNKRPWGQSKFMGVWKNGKRWSTQVMVHGKIILRASYVSEEEAARARDAVAVPLGFRPNFPVSKKGA